MRYKLYTNVSDFTGNRTVPSMDTRNTRSNAARVPSPTVLYRIRVVKYEYSYCKVLYLPHYCTVLNLLRYLQYCTAVSTTYYLLPTTYYLLPTTYYLLPTTYYLLPTTIPAIPTYYLLYLLPTTCYLLHSVPYYCTYYLLPTTYYLLPSSFNRQTKTPIR